MYITMFILAILVTCCDYVMLKQAIRANDTTSKIIMFLGIVVSIACEIFLLIKIF